MRLDNDFAVLFKHVGISVGMAATIAFRVEGAGLCKSFNFENLKFLSDRAISAVVHGRPGAEAALVKLVWADVSQHIGEVAGELLGPDGLLVERARERVAARGLSIAGGTTQVNKNIVARRVLGLPKGK